MVSIQLSGERKSMINALLAETGTTVEELIQCYELNRKASSNVSSVRYLSINEVCKLCSVSRFTVYRWTRKGVIRFCKLTKARGGKVLIDANSLFAYLESCGDGNSDSVKC